jgi:hypothetical protein
MPGALGPSYHGVSSFAQRRMRTADVAQHIVECTMRAKRIRL